MLELSQLTSKRPDKRPVNCFSPKLHVFFKLKELQNLKTKMSELIQFLTTQPFNLKGCAADVLN